MMGSSIMSLFPTYGFKLKPNNDLNISYIDSIKEMISKLDFNCIVSALNTLKNQLIIMLQRI